MTFISDFDSSTGTIKSFSKEINEIVFTESSFKGVKIKIIGEQAGSYRSLTKIDMKNTEIIEIKSAAFTQCTSLSEVSFPDSLISIGANAFCCANLTVVNIPANVKSMSGFAWNQIPYVSAFIVNESNSISVDDVNANADYDAYGTDRRENDDNNEINDNIVEMMIEVCSAILWNNMSSNMI